MFATPDPERAEAVFANPLVVNRAAPVVVVGGGPKDAEVDTHGYGADPCEASTRTERVGGCHVIVRVDSRDGSAEERV